jgi:hypothetical protein
LGGRRKKEHGRWDKDGWCCVPDTGGTCQNCDFYYDCEDGHEVHGGGGFEAPIVQTPGW